ncbi:hypothetical protein EC991_009228 [Linnemannia zychae]|nr:hypothetical protein EC991_009228 [Linnemannia zychae]
MSLHVRPLDLPEIIARVGHFIPLWTRERTYGSRIRTVFKPKTLQACLLVSKLWHQTLLPVLWALFDAEGMCDVPADILLNNSIYFRTFYMQQSHDGTKYFSGTRLLNAYLVADTNSLDQTRQIVQSNSGIKSLEWIGPDSSHCLEPNDLAHLSQLQRLALSRWDVSEGRFDKILKALAGSLRRLDIGWSVNMSKEQCERNEEREAQEWLTEDSDEPHNQDKRPLELPLLEFLRANNAPYSPDPADIIRACLNLTQLELSLYNYENYVIDKDLASISNSIKECCPKLYSFVIMGMAGQEHKAKLIHNCAATNSLSELVVEVSSVGEEIIDSIIRHAPTLETVGVQNTTEDNDDASLDLLFQLPARCPRMKHLSITAWYCYGSSRSALDIVKATISTWQCRELEVLDLDIGDPSRGFPWREKSTLDEIFEDGPVLGWYYHPKESLVAGDNDIYWDTAFLEDVFETVKGLEKLCVMRWFGVVLTRSNDASSARFGRPSMF